ARRARADGKRGRPGGNEIASDAFHERFLPVCSCRLRALFLPQASPLALFLETETRMPILNCRPRLPGGSARIGSAGAGGAEAARPARGFAGLRALLDRELRDGREHELGDAHAALDGKILLAEIGEDDLDLA